MPFRLDMLTQLGSTCRKMYMAEQLTRQRVFFGTTTTTTRSMS
jgi:hypothetical protein